MNKKINLAVVTGGNASELEVSLKSAQVVINNLSKDKYQVFKVDISNFPWKVDDLNSNQYTIDMNDFSVRETGVKFDAVFIAIHGNPAENGKIQGYFDLLNIPYSASSVLASALTFDKDITKQLVKDTGVMLAKSILLYNNVYNIEAIKQELSLPIFVKPNKNGSSYGISKVKDYKDLEAALHKSFQFDDEVLVEEFIDGREIASGVFEKDGEIICLPLTEIETENEFFDYEAKYLGKSKETTPAPVTEQQKELCFKYTKQIYKKLKLSGMARVDYFLKGDDVYLLEVNTIPGLSEESLLPQQARAYGFTLEQFFDHIISDSIAATNNLNS